MYETDKGVAIIIRIKEQNGMPADLTHASTVDLLLKDGTVLPLTIIDPTNGWAQYLTTGLLPAGYKQGNVRVVYDPSHQFATDLIEFHLKPLGT